MQPFELTALVAIVLGIAIVLLIGRRGAAIGGGRKAALGIIIGLLAAVVVLVRATDLLPDDLQRPSEVLFVVAVTVLLVAARWSGLAGPGGPRR